MMNLLLQDWIDPSEKIGLGLGQIIEIYDGSIKIGHITVRNDAIEISIGSYAIRIQADLIDLASVRELVLDRIGDKRLLVRLAEGEDV